MTQRPKTKKEAVDWSSTMPSVRQTSSFEETRTKTGTVTRSLNRPGDQLFPTNRLLISKDSSAQFESGVGQISSFEETRAKSGTVTRSLNRPGDQLFPTNRMLISKDSSGQYESGVGTYKMLISQDLSTKLKDSSA
ncbi:hypothetical protein FSP39_018397 [Pinctada imbricata]|uniref:Uncharacterized protein n=1 Tax=Pinctada imbricata TaxID=66713 RepID=A0AA88YRU0_PINIB|nr:hypothetical protein FSP39_018397 [Pinctada imbricata]